VLSKQKNKKSYQRFISKSIIGQQWIDAQEFKKTVIAWQNILIHVLALRTRLHTS
jgi:hypothetical protein